MRARNKGLVDISHHEAGFLLFMTSLEKGHHIQVDIASWILSFVKSELWKLEDMAPCSMNLKNSYQ